MPGQCFDHFHQQCLIWNENHIWRLAYLKRLHIKHILVVSEVFQPLACFTRFKLFRICPADCFKWMNFMLCLDLHGWEEWLVHLLHFWHLNEFWRGWKILPFKERGTLILIYDRLLLGVFCFLWWCSSIELLTALDCTVKALSQEIDPLIEYFTIPISFLALV